MAQAALSEIIAIGLSLPAGGAGAGYVMARMWLLSTNVWDVVAMGVGMVLGLSVGAIVLFLAMDSRRPGATAPYEQNEEAS